MIATFTALLFAHVMADFVLQTGWIAANKRRFGVLMVHGALVLLTAQAALGSVAWPLLALAAAHLLIDLVKLRMPRTTAAFLADQAAHLATLAALAWAAPHLWSQGLWSDLPQLPPLMALLAGLILTTRAGGFVIALLMAPWAAESLEGLPRAGALIGLLERGIVFLLVMVGQPAGIGFLIAAKSVLRFDTASRDQRAGEYVIIGTLASFGWALLGSYATLALLSRLPPLGILPVTP